MKVTYLGTTMLLFDDGDNQILFDCHITRPSIWKFLCGKLQTDTAVANKVMDEFKIDRLKAIFISHTHHDHVMDAPYFASKCDADIYGSSSAVQVALGGGISRERIHSYEDDMEFCIGDYKIKVIPSVHSVAHWYNDDLGEIIDKPLIQPAKKSAYKEGGSFDFLVEHSGKKYLIRPSYNFIVGQLDGIEADVLFLGIAGLSKDTKDRQQLFFAETVKKTKPQMIIPVHWDNFLTPLYKTEKWMTGIVENPQNAIAILENYCKSNQIDFILQMPLSSVEIAEN